MGLVDADNPTTQWRQLTASAVLGTDRTGPNENLCGGKVGEMLAQRTTNDAPSDLLIAAALLGLYERTGRKLTAQTTETPNLPEDDDSAECSARAANQLAGILDGKYTTLLNEWCRLAAKRNIRASNELLPAIMDRCISSHATIDWNLASKIVGKRGYWLAQQNEAWQALLISDDPAETWRTGLRDQREKALIKMRAEDPDKARQLVAETWSEEDPDSRAPFIECHSVGLSMADEEFLESALDDKRKTARSAAANLLAQLPESHHCQRMQEVAQSLVKGEHRKRRLRSDLFEISVELPSTVDKAMERDGIEEKKKHGFGGKAYALHQIIGSTPLSNWSTTAEPAEWIEAADKTEWKDVLIRGWGLAAGRQQNAEWAELLVPFHLTNPKLFDNQWVTPLLKALSDQQFNTAMTNIIKSQGKRMDDEPLLNLLTVDYRNWSVELSRVILRFVRSYFASEKSQYQHKLRTTIIQEYGCRLHPNLSEEVYRDWPENSPYWHKGNDEMVGLLSETLRFRRAMWEEFCCE